MIVIRADGNKEIGMGHIGRCLCVVKALKKQNVDLLWIISSDSDSESLESEYIDFVRADENSKVVFNVAFKDTLANNNVTSVLLDSYSINKEEINILSQKVPVYYIDDLNLFDYNVKGIINYNFEANEKTYSNTQFKTRKMFLGPKYFPLNIELWNTPRCEINRKVKNVLITSGSTDPTGCIETILSNINPSQYSDIKFQILVGKFFEKEYRSMLYDKYSKKNNVEFVQWGKNIAELYSGVDLLIAPGATMIFEGLALGIPCISYMFADNQRMQCDIMSELGIVPFIGDFRGDTLQINNTFESSLLYESRKHAQALFSNLIDGYGAQRIASVLLGKQE